MISSFSVAEFLGRSDTHWHVCNEQSIIGKSIINYWQIYGTNKSKYHSKIFQADPEMEDIKLKIVHILNRGWWELEEDVKVSWNRVSIS